MYESIYDTAYAYMRYYQNSSIAWWDQLGPWDYGSVLALIGFIGWYLMRGNKR